jgi:glycerol-3-phosphate O-acyltransferase
MKAYCREARLDFNRLERSRRFAEIETLSDRLMAGIAAVVPVLPVPLVAAVFLESASAEIDIMEIEQRSNRMIDRLKAAGAPVFEVPRSTRARTIADAVEFLRLRRLIVANGRCFKRVPEEVATLEYYANSIGHWRRGVDTTAGDGKEANGQQQATYQPGAGREGQGSGKGTGRP